MVAGQRRSIAGTLGKRVNLVMLTDKGFDGNGFLELHKRFHAHDSRPFAYLKAFLLTRMRAHWQVTCASSGDWGPLVWTFNGDTETGGKVLMLTFTQGT